MPSSSWPFAKQIASVLVVLMAASLGVMGQQPGRQPTTAQGAQSAPPHQAQGTDSAAVAGSTNANANAESAALAPASAGGRAQQGQSTAAGESETSSDQEQNGPAKPVGTAAAVEANPAGVAGSRLTGAVVAPAKQRRIHSIAIRVAIIVGAAVAIGTVAALSRSSPSQPR